MEDISSYFKDKTVLIVDDDAYVLDMLHDMLEDYFLDIVIAKDGLECLEYLDYYNPDLLITDIEMPNFNGLKAIEKIRETDFDIPIIIMSAYDDKTFLHKAVNLDIQGYIYKPIDFTVLLNNLQKLVKFNNPNALIKIDDTIQFDEANSNLILAGNEVPLTLREKELLKLFIAKKGQAITYDTIESSIWDKHNEAMSISSLRTLIKQLRLKMGKDLIKNISKVGYRFETD